LLRTTLVATGGVLIVAAPVVGIIPGPGGVFVFAGGLVLVLQNASWARRHLARAKRRWPRFGALADRALGRGARLRRLRERQESR
jgi:hypothetical protein